MLYDSTPLAKNSVFSNDASVTGVNSNVLVAGGAGTGKTVSVTEPQLLHTFHNNLIVTITKRRIFNEYSNLLRARGYEVIDMNFASPDKANYTFDPVKFLKKGDTAAIRCLAESIVYALPNSREKVNDLFWTTSAVSLLSAEISLIVETMKEPSLADVIHLHRTMKISETRSSEGISTTLDSLFEKLEQRDPASFAVANYRTFAQNPPRTAGCIYTSLNTAIDAIFTDDLLEMIATRPSLDITDFLNKKFVLFITSSPVNPARNHYISMFYSQAIKMMFEYAEAQESGQLPIPVKLICDDFATGSRIHNFPEYISIFREKLISVTLLVQSFSQLETMYSRSEYTTIINNCDSILYLGGMDLQTAQDISIRADVPLHDVLYMKVGELYLFRRGMRPIHSTRYETYKDAEYARLEALKRLMERAS